MTGQARRHFSREKTVGGHLPLQSEVEGAAGKGPANSMTPLDASSYILSMATELRALARVSNLQFLTYLLEMVFQEAFRLTSELERSKQQKPEETQSEAD
jgi:hypothetical protein